MGYHTHHAIAVTSWHDESLEKAHEHATRIFAALDCAACVGSVLPGVVNGFRSFLIQPDGSKDGWEASDHADTARQVFKAWLIEHQLTVYTNWVEVVFGEVDACHVVDDHVRHAILETE